MVGKQLFGVNPRHGWLFALGGKIGDMQSPGI
jgi:hypothetical protein